MDKLNPQFENAKHLFKIIMPELVSVLLSFWSEGFVNESAWKATMICTFCSLEWIWGQSDFKLVWFDFSLFHGYGNKSRTKQNQIKLLWNHFDLTYTFYTFPPIQNADETENFKNTLKNGDLKMCRFGVRRWKRVLLTMLMPFSITAVGM